MVSMRMGHGYWLMKSSSEIPGNDRIDLGECEIMNGGDREYVEMLEVKFGEYVEMGKYVETEKIDLGECEIVDAGDCKM